MCLYNVVSNLVENLLAILAYSEIKFKSLRACLYGGEGLQIGEVTCGGSPHLSCKRDQIEMRDYMDRRVTPSKRITSPTWSPPPPCKQAPNLCNKLRDSPRWPALAKRFP